MTTKGGKGKMTGIIITLQVLLALFLLTVLIYAFNLDNKLIFYVVRPILNKKYDKQQRDVKL